MTWRVPSGGRRVYRPHGRGDSGACNPLMCGRFSSRHRFCPTDRSLSRTSYRADTVFVHGYRIRPWTQYSSRTPFQRGCEAVYRNTVSRVRRTDTVSVRYFRGEDSGHGRKGRIRRAKPAPMRRVAAHWRIETARWTMVTPVLLGFRFDALISGSPLLFQAPVGGRFRRSVRRPETRATTGVATRPRPMPREHRPPRSSGRRPTRPPN